MAKLTFGRIARIALAGSAMLGAAAQAIEVKFQSINNGMWSNGLTLGAGTANYWTGDLKIQVRDDDQDTTPDTFEAFCIDPYQSASNGFTSYTETTLSTTFDTVKIGKIEALFSYYDSYLTGEAASSRASAFQLALWEVANDNGVLGDGSVKVIAGTTNPDLVTRAQGLLDGYSNYRGPSLYSFTFYKSDVQQDFIVATKQDFGTPASVPEPETYAMMLAGLGLMGAIARRRKAKSV